MAPVSKCGWRLSPLISWRLLISRRSAPRRSRLDASVFPPQAAESRRVPSALARQRLHPRGVGEGAAPGAEHVPGERLGQGPTSAGEGTPATPWLHPLGPTPPWLHPSTSISLSPQKQIAQGIKFGQRPPSLRRSEEEEGSTDEEEAPQSPLRAWPQAEAEPEAKVRALPVASEPALTLSVPQQAPPPELPSTPLRSPRPKCSAPPAGTIESINLDAVPQSAPRLDNAAAKHKLSVKPKNQRVSRKHRRFTQVRGGGSTWGGQPGGVLQHLLWCLLRTCRKSQVLGRSWRTWSLQGPPGPREGRRWRRD